MKTKYILMSLAACMLSACSNDGDTIYTGGGDDVTINGNDGDIVLDYTNLNALALTVYWSENGSIALSDPRVEAPAYAITNTVQLSDTQDFANVVESTMDKGVYYMQYTHGVLNNLLGRLGFAGGEMAPLYIRIKSVLGANLAPTFSNVLAVNVTPYVIDMTIGYYLDNNKGETTKSLYSANSDGIYTGFIGAGAWENWYLREGNGVLWGNENVDWYAFKLGSEATAGNMWYPGISGCYYTIVNTQTALWSAELVTDMAVSGDINGDMTYDRASNCWMYTFNAAPGTYNVTIQGNSKLYDVNTGTTDANAIDGTIAFAGNADALELSSQPQTIAVTTTSSGEACLTLNLSDPTCWTLSVGEGSAPTPVVVNHYLYITGIDDGISGSWTYDNYLIVYNEDSRNYGGACNVNSKWGYVYMIQNFWGDGYGFDSGDAMQGSLNTDPSSNIAAPEPGQYVFDVSLNDMSYKLTKIESVSYAGLNDDWTMQPMTRTTGCTYEAVVTKSANTPWGVKIYINDSWDIYFGGKGNELVLFANGFEGDNDLENGDYLLRVDLNQGTFSYTKQ